MLSTEMISFLQDIKERLNVINIPLREHSYNLFDCKFHFKDS